MNSLFEYMPDLIVFGLIYFRFLYPKWKNDRSVLIRRTFIMLYLLVILQFTLLPALANLPSRFSESGFNYNFTPFIDWAEGRGNYRFETFANVLLFVPYGFLLRSCGDMKLSKAVLTGFLTSFAIEFAQPLLSSFRICDISDVITNTAGTLIGALAAHIIFLLFFSKRAVK